MRRRISLLLINTLLALGISCVWVDPLWAEPIIVYAGYPVIFLTFAIFVASLAKLLLAPIRNFKSSREDFAPLLTIAGSSTVLFLHEPFRFKIVMDELVLLATSMMMHFEKLVAVPVGSNNYYGSFQLVGGYLDKRPYFHPFLLSLVHTLTGYRPENAFLLNAILTVLLLFLAYLFGIKISGRRGGILAILLLTSIPLLAQNATGGHFEILNLVMLLGAMLLSCRYLENPDFTSLTALCFCGLLLAQTRYESVMFVLPISAVVLAGWIRKGNPILSWPAVFAPYLLLGYPLHFRVTLSQPDFSQLLEKGNDKAFSIGYFNANLDHALTFLFQMGQRLSNSVLLSLLGVIGLFIFIVHVSLRWKRVWREAIPEWVLFIFLGGVLLSFLLTMGYHWGQYDDPIASRFSLPLLLFFVFVSLASLKILPGPYLLSVLGLFGYVVWFYLWGLEPLEMVTVGARLALLYIIAAALTLLVLLRHWNTQHYLLGVTLLFIIFVTVPVVANHRYSQISTPAMSVEIMRQFFKNHPEKDYFFTSRSTLVASTHSISSAPIHKLRMKPEIIAEHLLHRNYSAVYAFQLVDVDPETGDLYVVDKYDLGPRYKFEVVLERRLVPLQLARIVRIVRVDPPEEEDSGEDNPERDH